MNIGYIFNDASKVTGVESVSISTCKELLKLNTNNNYRIVAGNPFDVDMPTMHRLYEGNRMGSVDFQCKLYDLDLIHSFFPAIDDVHSDVKKVITIHDVIPMTNPEWFFPDMCEFFNTRIRRSIENADCVLADSEATKSEILREYNTPEEKVRVLYIGLNNTLKYAGIECGTKDKFDLESGYILSVCTLEPRKNLQGLIKAFITYKERTKADTKLVLAGRVGHDKDLFPFLESLGTWKKDIVITGYVTETELAELYHNALAVAYVSFREGFGLPILEGMAAGKAVITSNISSMPEVGGDAVCYCNPYELDSISDAIMRVIEDDAYRIGLESKATKQAALFSYEKTAKQLLDIYGEILNA